MGHSLLLLIRSLETGGAERQLTALAIRLAARGHRVSVALFYAKGPFLADLRAAGVPVFDLRKAGRWDVLGFVLRWMRLVRNTRPETVYTFLPMANVIGTLARIALPGVRLVWGVRATNMELAQYGWFARLEYGLQKWLQWVPHEVIANARAAADAPDVVPVRARKFVVIPNGVDMDRFRPDLEGRGRVRAEWGIPDTAYLVGLVARIDPMKDHETFLRAAAAWAAQRPEVRFVCVGDGEPNYADRMKALAHDLELDGRLYWAGSRTDMPAVYNALDVLASTSSFGEGFSNVIAEGMASALPVVATDVGDSAWIVGDASWIVAPGDPSALVCAWERLYLIGERKRLDLRHAMRKSAVERFGFERIVDALEKELWP